MRLLYLARDLRSKKLYQELDKYCQKDVLDVGGGFFYTTARKRLHFSSWTSLEASKKYAYKSIDKQYHLIIGDGCKMKFKTSSFDTVLCLQVLEHVYEPNKMFSEIARVLKPGGFSIIMVPQTSNIHMVPDHFYNFTKYWLKRAAKENNLKIVKYLPLGGFWSSAASRFFYFFLQSLYYEAVSDDEATRSWLYYLLLPLMWIFATLSLPICLLLAFADLVEEPNNHLLVLRK